MGAGRRQAASGLEMQDSYRRSSRRGAGGHVSLQSPSDPRAIGAALQQASAGASLDPAGLPCGGGGRMP